MQLRVAGSNREKRGGPLPLNKGGNLHYCWREQLAEPTKRPIRRRRKYDEKVLTDESRIPYVEDFFD